MPKLDPHIFRAYDIRGRTVEQIDETACQLIGNAFGREVIARSGKDHPSIVAGRDARLTSPAFLEAVIEGLTSAGCNVLNMGETPSPLNYFTICNEKLDGGVQITASHNPGSDNGIKLQLKNAEAFSGEDLQRLRENIENYSEESAEGPVLSRRVQIVPSPNERGLGRGEKGTITVIDAVTPYRNFLRKMFGMIGKGITVIVDCGNGVAGPVYVQILRDTGATVIELYTEPDGNFPNHPADPSKHATLKDLQRAVVKHNAAFGLAFDGDGDRLGIVDEKGAIRNADEILLLLAKDLLSRHPGSPVILTVSNSSILMTEIPKFGGIPVMCKVGHSYVEHAMREHGAKLGGEQSGHFFCEEDYYGFDDALVAALRILNIFSNQQSATSNSIVFSQLFATFPKVYQAHERRPHCADNRKSKIVAAVSTHFEKLYPVNTLDGVRIDFGDGAWAGIRQSNTSPCLSICIEARSPEELRNVEDTILSHLRTYPELKDIE